MCLTLKVKSNGHSVGTKLIRKQSLSYEIAYYIQKFKLPINIYVNQVKTEKQNALVSKKPSISQQVQQQKQMQDDYDLGSLSEQVMLFDSDKQILDYISTEKLLAHDVQQKLSKLCKALILVANQKFQKKREYSSFSQLAQKVEEKNITKQQLNEIQMKCMQTLSRVQQQRKKLELCVVCWENMSNTILIPCMHMVMCNKCPRVRSCPVCKTSIQSSAGVYR